MSGSENSKLSVVKLSEVSNENEMDKIDDEWVKHFSSSTAFNLNFGYRSEVVSPLFLTTFEEDCSSSLGFQKGWCPYFQILTPRTDRSLTIRQMSLPFRFWPLGRKDLMVTLLWIACGWMLLALDWSLYFIRGYNTNIPLHPKLFNIEKSNSSISIAESEPTAEPTYFDYDFLQGDSRDLIFIWVKLFSRSLVFIPLGSIINLSIFTNLNSFTGWKLARKLTIIYLTQITIAGPYAASSLIDWGDKTMDWLELVGGTTLFNLTLTLEWWVLARCLSMDWQINVKWLPAFQLCQALVLIAIGTAMVAPKEFLSDILLYVPLILMILELVFKKVLTFLFDQYKRNSRGLILCMAFVISPMEVLRFGSFLLIFMQHKLFGVPYSHILWSASFSIIGEIFTHTGVYKLIKTCIISKFAGVHKDDFPEVHANYASVRGVLEFVAPTFLVANILMSNACFYHLPILSKKWNFIFFSSSKWLMEQGLLEPLVTYYIVELISFFLCGLICKLTSYERTSAMKGLKWSTIFTMIVFVGTAVDVPITGYALVRLANIK